MVDYARGGINGFIGDAVSPLACGATDTYNMMWGANDDGDPVDGQFVDEPVWTCEWGWIKSAVHAHAILFLDYPGRTSESPIKLSYNWWSGYVETPQYDYGPMLKSNYRDFGTGGTGWPWGDANRYYVMSNGEIDYDLLYSASIASLNPLWIEPPGEIALIASTRGLDTAPPNMLSIGPFELPPGHSIDVPFAIVGGQNLHTDPFNSLNLPYFVDRFYQNLDFSNLMENATYAKWTYDNPGVDTDNDHYAGEFTICNGDTVYYTGDGIPDWRGAMPPPAPYFWLEPIANGVRVRFNGTQSETAKDRFSGTNDFEGYRIYCGLDERQSSMCLVATYDKDDYDKLIWMGDSAGELFLLIDPPYTLDSLRCLYGTGDDPCTDTLFDPRQYTIDSPFIFHGPPDSMFYFVAHDFNCSEFGVETSIRKVYPDEPYPVSLNSEEVPDEALTPEGYLKYFEYEFTLTGLMPTIPYWINITALDFGTPSLNLVGLETSKSVGAKFVYPLGASEVAENGNSAVYVYPNPYRLDADYRDHGFEGRLDDDRPDHRVRAIHFGNLPAKCTIWIYSIDGDLIREIKHDMDPSDPNCSREIWNMITRNTQMVVTGLYYWVVEAEDGTTQMGKLAIIM